MSVYFDKFFLLVINLEELIILDLTGCKNIVEDAITAPSI